MKSVRVSLKDRSYSILIGRDLFVNAGRYLKKAGLGGSALVVSQHGIAGRYRDPLAATLSKEGIEHEFFLTPRAKSSEADKSQAVFLKLIRAIAGFDGRGKGVFVIALGGGVIGDLAGFAASVYRRGIPYVQIPTTLTSQVDSSIGGKTAIDLPEGKNLLGSIYQPALVLSDVTLLGSLPDRQWSDGFAEVIKYGVIEDPRLFADLERHGRDALRADARKLVDVIHRCAKIKARVVERDERDKKDLRITLNFGHTTGHAIEAASRYSRGYTHGEAVGIGMLVACDLAQELGVLKDASLTRRLEAILVKFGLPVYFRGLSIEAILKAVGYDKKSEKGVNRFVLPVSPGKTAVYCDVPSDVLVRCLNKRKG